MTAKLVFAAAMLGVVAVSPVVAQDQGKEQAAPAKEKRTCRTETSTGSLLPHRRCLTASEWAEIDARNARNTEAFTDAKSRSLGSPNF